MKPNFFEAINWITTQDRVEEFAKLMDSVVSSIKQKYNQTNERSLSQKYISSDLKLERSGKHHGYDEWKQKRKSKK